jgi:hypothetical protein
VRSEKPVAEAVDGYKPQPCNGKWTEKTVVTAITAVRNSVRLSQLSVVTSVSVEEIQLPIATWSLVQLLHVASRRAVRKRNTPNT